MFIDVFPCLHFVSELCIHAKSFASKQNTPSLYFAAKNYDSDKTKDVVKLLSKSSFYCINKIKTFTDKTNKASMKEMMAYSYGKHT